VKNSSKLRRRGGMLFWFLEAQQRLCGRIKVIMRLLLVMETYDKGFRDWCDGYFTTFALTSSLHCSMGQFRIDGCSVSLRSFVPIFLRETLMSSLQVCVNLTFTFLYACLLHLLLSCRLIQKLFMGGSGNSHPASLDRTLWGPTMAP
jgi:hypothetical protein